MTQFTVQIGDKTCIASGSIVQDINPKNGMDYSVFSVSDLRIVNADGTQSEDVRTFVKAKDAMVREEEKALFEAEYTQKWEKDFAAWKQRNPNATEDQINAYAEHWESLAENRRLQARRTNGLHAVITLDGKAFNAYFMRESAEGMPKFRTYVPREVSERAGASVNPF